ncbi:MAG TPA: GNAT family N-acetyltransferase [Deltaproteobacteria bacterium]|nr:GNAT family N-acetyltransferase [Deltaproteobacteria bacterium]
MGFDNDPAVMAELKKRCSGKFAAREKIFSHIHRGNKIFIPTGCAEPQYLINSFCDYARSHPKAVFDAEFFYVLTFGAAPHLDEMLESNFRQNTFFVGDSTRHAVNNGLADYTPVFLSQIPVLLRRKLIPVDVAMIQTSLPDENGRLSLGISVDITRAAIEQADLVIAQINAFMPRVHGDTFIHIDDIDFAIHHDEPILEYESTVPDEIARSIGKYVSRIIEDGSTIQVGYGSLPNAIVSSLGTKKHLGIHTEVLSNGLVDLIRKRVVDNTRKSVDKGKTVASVCLGNSDTYEYIHDNPHIDLRPIDYTNNPLVIARQERMVAINSALEVDLTGQATAESVGKIFYSGIGGQADFMRGGALAPEGKTILALQSTAKNGMVSRIVPFIREGAGVTLGRGDIHYVVTEYGIAYLQGKSIRERAMALISIAHPKFRAELIERAKALNLIYKDQAFIPGKEGEYPEHLEAYRTTKTGMDLFMRPVKISDERLLKNFVYSLSDQSIYYRFFSVRTSMPHEFLQKFVIIDYTKQMAIFAIREYEGREEIVGVGRYTVEEDTHMAGIALVVRDDYQNLGIGRELLSYLIHLAQKQGLLGVSSEMLVENKPMLHLLRYFIKEDYDIERKFDGGVYSFNVAFRDLV